MHYLVCVDGSDFARHAFHFVLEKLARDNEDKITLIHVTHSVKTSIIDPLGDNLDKMANLEEIEAGEKIKRYYQSECQALKINWEFSNIKSESDTGEAIQKTIEIVKPDIVIVGTRGLNKLKRLLLGSTSNYLIQNSTIPVLVVPPKDAHQHKD